MSRRVIAALAAVALAAGALALVLLPSEGDDRPIADRAAALFPRETFAYLHVSTDRDRDAVERALELAGGLEAFDRLGAFLVRRIGVDDAGELAEWVGDEAALGLLDAGTDTAASLVAVAVEDEKAARRALRGLGEPTARSRHGDVEVASYGASAVAFSGPWLLTGTPAAVRSAIDRQGGRGATLAGDERFRRAVEPLPAMRVADAYVTGDALRRVFAPQGGLYAAAATLLDQPGLQAAGIAVLAGERRADLLVRSLAARPEAGAATAFRPTLVERAPAGALAYLGADGADQALRRVLAVGGGRAGALARAVRARLGEEGGRAGRDLLALLRGEVAVLLTPGLPVPTLTLLARTEDERRARAALDRVARPLGAAAGAAEEPRVESVAGLRTTTVPLGGSLALSYATSDGLVIASTAPEGVRAVSTASDRLPEAEAFERVLADAPDRLSSLVFLDLDQLLGLAELTGIGQSPTYRQIRADLRRVRAIGASSTAGEGEATTTRVRIFIP